MPLLTAEDLNVNLRIRNEVRPIIEDVAFSIKEREILGVVGESGAGKSLTGLAIMQLLEPPLEMRGTMLFRGQRLGDLAAEALQKIRGRHIAAIFQDAMTALNPVMTIGKQITGTILAHLPVSRKEALERAAQLLADAGIPAPRERLKSYPHELSGGMRQRAVIALALCCEPELIIADEPTTALDVSVQAQIVELIRSLCERRGTSVLLITHDMGVIAGAANRVAVMYAGRIVETAPVLEIIKRPQHPYTKGLIGVIPKLRKMGQRLGQIQGSMPRPGFRPTGCAFHPRCPSAMPRCKIQQPPQFRTETGSAACWLFAPGGDRSANGSGGHLL
jgi:peptide/nickel transport system ATP-binding protein